MAGPEPAIENQLGVLLNISGVVVCVPLIVSVHAKVRITLTRENMYCGGVGVVAFPHNIEFELEAVALSLAFGFVEDDAELSIPRIAGFLNHSNGLVVLVCI